MAEALWISQKVCFVRKTEQGGRLAPFPGHAARPPELFGNGCERSR